MRGPRETGRGETGRGNGASARLARRALNLYPLAYRRRYGDELRALLEDQPQTPATVLDLLRGALVAHLKPANVPTGAVDPGDRLRASASGVLMCWIFFAAAGFGFYKTTEDDPFSVAGHVHPLLRDAHLVVQVLAVIASITVVLGALPLIMAAVARAARDRAMWRKVLAPFVPLAVFGCITAAAFGVAHAQGPGHTSDAGYGMAIVWGVAGLACGASSVLACRAALYATPVAPARLRAALAAATVLTIAMLAIAAATAIYAIALALDAGQLGGAPNGPFGLLSVTASLVLQVIVMIVAGTLATITTARGLRSAVRPPVPPARRL